MGVDEMTSLGWVGAGRMGHALVSRLLAAGHEVAVYNRTREKALDLAELGAHDRRLARRPGRPRHRLHDGRRLS